MQIVLELKIAEQTDKSNPSPIFSDDFYVHSTWIYLPLSINRKTILVEVKLIILPGHFYLNKYAFTKELPSNRWTDFGWEIIKDKNQAIVPNLNLVPPQINHTK